MVIRLLSGTCEACKWCRCNGGDCEGDDDEFNGLYDCYEAFDPSEEIYDADSEEYGCNQ